MPRAGVRHRRLGQRDPVKAAVVTLIKASVTAERLPGPADT